MVILIKQNYHQNIIQYEHIKKELIKLIGKNYAINHVGSTAIPNMVGKNIIDILIGVNKPDELNVIQNILTNNGYYLGNNQKKNYRFLASKTSETQSGDVHIHLAIIKQLRYQEFLILKDYLLENPFVASQYNNYKKEIVLKYGNERKKYRKIKGKYVKQLINDAKDYFIHKLPLSIIMIRHGENISNLSCDNNNLPLSEKGIKEAKWAKKRLKNMYDVIITSPSLRARQTAEIIHGSESFIIDERLIEKGYGNLLHNGKETKENAEKRLIFLFNCLNQYPRERILLVTHGSLMRLAENIIERNNFDTDHIDNCTIVMYKRYDNRKEYSFFKYKYIFKK